MDWQKHRLIIGGVVLLGLAGGLAWGLTSRESQNAANVTEQNEGLPEVPDLERDDIVALEVTRPEQATIRLEKRGDTWRVVAPVEADADGTAVDTALDKIVDLEIVGVAATRATNHERLEVDEAHGIKIVVHGAQGPLLTFFLGAYKDRNTMIRVDGQEQVLSARGSIKYAFNKDLKDWRDRKVIDETPAEVQEVVFEGSHGTYRFARDAGGTFAQAEGETPLERFQATKVQSLVSSLARMRAVDFAAEGVDAAAAGMGEPRSTVTLVVRPVPDTAPATDGGTAEEAPAEERRVVLRLGGAVEGQDNQHYVTREGSDVIFVVNDHLAGRLDPEASEFQAAEPGSEPETPPANPMGGLDLGGLGGLGGPGGPGGAPQIPPEILRQLQEQAARQGAGGHGHPH